VNKLPTTWNITDTAPPVGTAFEVGGPRDNIKFVLETDGWRYSVNDPFRKCTMTLVAFWAPLRVVRWGEQVLRHNGSYTSTQTARCYS
jgi:hypothetical protein